MSSYKETILEIEVLFEELKKMGGPSKPVGPKYIAEKERQLEEIDRHRRQEERAYFRSAAEVVADMERGWYPHYHHQLSLWKEFLDLMAKKIELDDRGEKLNLDEMDRCVELFQIVYVPFVEMMAAAQESIPEAEACDGKTKMFRYANLIENKLLPEAKKNNNPKSVTELQMLLELLKGSIVKDTAPEDSDEYLPLYLRYLFEFDRDKSIRDQILDGIFGKPSD